MPSLRQMVPWRAMLRLLKGLDKLAIAAARKPAVPLHVAVWQHVRHELGLPHAASACQHVQSTLGTCAAAFCDFDFVRAFGPPTAAYYFQESEWLCSRGCAKAPPAAATPRLGAQKRERCSTGGEGTESPFPKQLVEDTTSYIWDYRWIY